MLPRFFVAIAVLIGGLTATALPADGSHTTRLRASGTLGIEEATCRDVESKLGQLFFINVDGFQYEGGPIHPTYIELVRELNIGGVYPKIQPWFSQQQIQQDIGRLQTATELPLLIGVDRGVVTSGGESPETAMTGLGAASGSFSNANMYSPECLRRRAFIEAFLHRAAGLNLALGPTIERNASEVAAYDDPIGSEFLGQEASQVEPYTRMIFEAFNGMGVGTTMKHFPYTPETFDLHDESRQLSTPREEIMERLEIFRRSAPYSPLAMTTHIRESEIDDSIVTFSEEWVNILRRDLNFNGLVMTDGLFMIRDPQSRADVLAGQWSAEDAQVIPNDHEHSIFAARSILAGHDLIILESHSGHTREVFTDLHRMACQDSPTGNQLRANILRSYERIRQFKETNRAALRPQVNIPDDLIETAIAERGHIRPQGSGCQLVEIPEGASEEGKQMLEELNKTMQMNCNHNFCTDDSAWNQFHSRVQALGFPSIQTIPQPATPVPTAPAEPVVNEN